MPIPEETKKNYLAQCIKIAGEEICGPIPTPTGAAAGQGITVAYILNILISIIFPLSGVLLFFYLVAGGYNFLTSAGNPEKIKAGQGKITAALIGFFLLMASYLIVRILTTIFGLDTGIL
jgi:hypothetical protein